MPARHFSSVDFPEPLRPTMPKNSPSSTANETASSAWSFSWPIRRNGWSARSLSVWTRSCGRRNDFETPSTATAGRAGLGTALGYPRHAAPPDPARRPDPARTGGARRRARVLRRDVPAGGSRRTRHRRAVRPAQPLALAAQRGPRDALPAGPRQACPLRARRDLRRRRRRAALVAHVRALGGRDARRRRPPPALRARRLRPRFLRALGRRRRRLPAGRLLRPRPPARHHLPRPRGGDRVAVRDRADGQRPRPRRAAAQRAAARRPSRLSATRLSAAWTAYAAVEAIAAPIAPI